MGKSATQTRKNKSTNFDKSGLPTGKGWHDVKMEGVTDAAAYALEITGNSMMPVYRQGDTIIVSPAAKIRKGDRVVVRTSDGQVMAKVLQKKSAKQIELAAFNPDLPVTAIEVAKVDWMARIIWASQ